MDKYFLGNPNRSNLFGNQRAELQFSRELEFLRQQLLEMGGACEQQLVSALQALKTGHAGLAEQVILNDQKINQIEVSIDSNCLRILATRKPTARDLRLVMVVSKAITDIERMGDEIERIATLVTKKLELNEQTQQGLLTIGESVLMMTKRTFDAFARLDKDSALQIHQDDDWIDQQYKQLLDYTADAMKSDANFDDWFEVLWALRSLERIGDRCKNLCEHIYYLVTGDNMRHLTLSEVRERFHSSVRSD